MAHFVLVHGAWHGAWCWSRVLPLLWAAGHTAHAVTLTGVGERAHLLARDITLETHIADVQNFILAQEFDAAVVLVVHSYAGMLGTAVAERLMQSQPKLLAHLVYVDAAVPEPGESWSSRHASATKNARLSAAQASSLNAFPPPDPAVFGLAAQDHAWVTRRQTPHPAAPYTHALNFDPAHLAALPRTFIDCINPPLATIDAVRQRVRDAKFWRGQWAAQAKLVVMDTGHDPMISAPQELSQILLACARSA